MARYVITVNETARARVEQFEDYDSPLSLAEIKAEILANPDEYDVTPGENVPDYMITEWLEANAVLGGFGSEIDEILDVTETSFTESEITD